MKQRILRFSVCDQRITTEDVSVVADSKNYLAALFLFDSTWAGVEKTAVFSQGDKVYNMLLQDDMCRVPAEVITEGEFYVSVFGGDLITADKIAIEVTPSGLLEGVVPPVPTTDIYTQLVERVSSEAADAAASAELAVVASQMSQDFANIAESAKDTVEACIGQAMNSEQAAMGYMIQAGQAAENAEANAQNAGLAYEETVRKSKEAESERLAAQAAAERAETAAQKLAWKTVLDVTLTAEQGGVNTLLLALDNVSAVKNATKIKFAIMFPSSAACAANKFWLSVAITDESASYYSRSILGGYNMAGNANAEYYASALVDISCFYYNSNHAKAYQSAFQLPNPYFISSANSSANAKQITGGYPVNAIADHPPYLKITISGGVTFEKGTHVFMEVYE